MGARFVFPVKQRARAHALWQKAQHLHLSQCLEFVVSFWEQTWADSALLSIYIEEIGGVTGLARMI